MFILWKLDHDKIMIDQNTYTVSNFRKFTKPVCYKGNIKFEDSCDLSKLKYL